MQELANRPVVSTTIRSDICAIFVSLELSRSTWLITSLSPGCREKMSKHSVKAGDILRAAQSVDRKLITQVTVFDVYEGTGIEPGKKSIAIAVTLQPRDKTMTDEEIEAIAGKIVAEVSKKTGGTIRA